MQRDAERIMQGKEPTEGSKNGINTVPYLLKDNKKLLNQTIAKHGREATKQAHQVLANHTEKHKHTQAQQDNFKAIEQTTGYQRGTPMTFKQADNEKSNIVKDKSNCAACVLTQELRLRGFDITAKPYNKKTNSISEQLATDTRLAWLDSKGHKPQYTALVTGSRDDITNKINKHTAALGSRYHIGWDTDQDLGHIVTMERTKQGLTIYDPQNDTFLSLEKIINEMMPQTALQLLRVDTLLVNPQLLHDLTTLLIK